MSHKRNYGILKRALSFSMATVLSFTSVVPVFASETEFTSEPIFSDDSVIEYDTEPVESAVDSTLDTTVVSDEEPTVTIDEVEPDDSNGSETVVDDIVVSEEPELVIEDVMDVTVPEEDQDAIMVENMVPSFLTWDQDAVTITAKPIGDAVFSDGDSLMVNTISDYADTEEAVQALIDSLYSLAAAEYGKEWEGHASEYPELYLDAFDNMHIYGPSVVRNDGSIGVYDKLQYTYDVVDADLLNSVLSYDTNIRVVAYNDTLSDAYLLPANEVAMYSYVDTNTLELVFDSEYPVFAVYEMDGHWIGPKLDADGNPIMESESEGIVIGEPETEAYVESETEPISEETVETEVEPSLETELLSESDTETEPVTNETELDTESVSDIETETDIESESDAAMIETELETESEFETESESESETMNHGPMRAQARASTVNFNIKLVDEWDETVSSKDMAGYTVKVYDDWSLNKLLGELTDNGDGRYSGQISGVSSSFYYTVTGKDELYASDKVYGTMSNYDYSGTIAVSKGPLYYTHFRVKMRDKLTGELVDGFKIRHEQYSFYKSVGRHTWWVNGAPFTSIGGGMHIDSPDGYVQPVVGFTGPEGGMGRFVIESAPEGYSTEGYGEYTFGPDMSLSGSGKVTTYDVEFPVTPICTGSFLLKDKKTDSFVENVSYQIYEDADCTISVKDADKNELKGVTAQEPIEVTLPYRESGYYVKFTDVPDGFLDVDGIFYFDIVNGSTFYLTPYGDVQVVASVIDSIVSQTDSIPGFTLGLKQYSEKRSNYVDVDTTAVLNEDGTYSFDVNLTETDDNHGLFLLYDKAAPDGYIAGTSKEFDIHGVYGELSVVLDKADRGSLYDILAKDENEECIGIIHFKNGRTLISSTEEADVVSKQPVSKSTTIHVELKDLCVDDAAELKENFIYNMLLPDDVIPVMNNGTTNLFDWKPLYNKGEVLGYARINQVVDSIGVSQYFYEMYFVNTAGKYDIHFGYDYDATINDRYSNGGNVLVHYPIDKDLSFDVAESTKTETKLEMYKYAGWTYDTAYGNDTEKDSGPYQSGGCGGNTDYNRAVFTIGLVNHTEDNLNLKLTESIPTGYLIKFPHTSDESQHPFRVYISEDGTNWTRYKMDRRGSQMGTYNTSSDFDIHTNSNGSPMVNGAISVTLGTDYTSDSTGYYAPTPKSYHDTTASMDIVIKNVRAKYMRLVYYADAVYTTTNYNSKYEELSIHPGSRKYYNHTEYDSSAYSFKPSVLTTISDIDMKSVKSGEYPVSCSAIAYKYYTDYSVDALSVNQISTMDPRIANSSDSTDISNKVDFHYQIKGTGGEHWVELTEFPHGSDWGGSSGPNFVGSSTNYYFRQLDFVSGSYNSMRIMVNGVNLLGNNNSTRISFSSMKGYDYKSYVELKTLLRDIKNVSYSENDLHTYRVQIDSNGVSRYVWLVMAPELYNGIRAYSVDASDVPLISTQMSGSYADRNAKYGLPLGMKWYILGLSGTETIDVYYSKYQRKLSTDYRGITYNSSAGDYVPCSTQLIGSNLSTRNRSYASTQYTCTEDSADNMHMLTMSGKLLSDGSIQYTVALDADQLYAMQKLNSYRRTTFHSNYSYLKLKLPNGYTLASIDMGYDDTFQSNVSYTRYRSGLLYYWNGSGYQQYGSRFNGPDGLPYTAYDLNRTYYQNIEFGDILDDMIYQEKGHYYVRFMCIAIPVATEYSLVNGNQSVTVDTKAEFLVMNKGQSYSYPENMNRWIDAIAVTHTVLPGMGSKFQYKAGINKWHSVLSVDVSTKSSDCNSYQFSGGNHYGTFGADVINVHNSVEGTISIHDDMQGSYLVDDTGKRVDVDFSKFVKLNRVSYTFKQQDSNSNYGGAIDLSTTKGNDSRQYDTYMVPMFGYEAYEAEIPCGNGNGYQGSFGNLFYNGYRPVKVKLLYNPKFDNPYAMSRDGRKYGGDMYGMAGGFDLTLSNLPYITSLVIEYDTEFDYEAFAKEYPNLGHVTLYCVNTAYSNYDSIANHRNNKTVSTISDFSYATGPDIQKKEESLSGDTYSRIYHITADVGALSQDSVYLTDQIDKVRDYAVKGHDEPIDVIYDSPEDIAKWLDCLDVTNVVVKARSYVNADTYKEHVIYENGAVVDDSYVFTPIDQSVLDEVAVPEGFSKLTGNLFAWEVSKSDGSEIPAHTCFIVDYKLEIKHDKVLSEDGTSEITPFRHLDIYSGGNVYFQNHASISYHESEELSEDGSVVDVGWAAAGATVFVPYLREHEASKVSKPIRSDVEDGKQHRTGISYFDWALINKDWTAGNPEQITHHWNDTMLLSALLDSEQAEDANKGFGDDSLNAAWVNLFYKYLTFTDWSVTVSDTLDKDVTFDLTGTLTDNGYHFVSEDGGNITVDVLMDALEYRDGAWQLKQQNASYTDTDKAVYDMYGIGSYVQKYYTKEENDQLKEQYPDGQVQAYGYGVNHLFNVDIANHEYLNSIQIDYHAEIDWDALYGDADARPLADGFVNWVKEHQDVVGEVFVSAMDATIQRQAELDVLSERLGTSLYVGVADLPRYSEILNAGECDGELDVDRNSWKYSPESSGSIGKSGKVTDDGIVWTVDLNVGAGTFLGYQMQDVLSVPEDLSDEVMANSLIGLQNMDITSFAVLNGDTDEILYQYDGSFDESASMGSNDLYTNGTVDFTTEDALYHLSFDRILSDSHLKFVYTTKMDEQGFLDDGGQYDISVVVDNNVTSSVGNRSLNTDANVKWTPYSSTTLEKESFEYGLANEVGYRVQSVIGNADVSSFVLQDGLSGSNEDMTALLLPYMAITSMKVSLSNGEPDVEPTVIYDSAVELNQLAEHGFVFDDAFALNTNGVSSFGLTFAENETIGKLSAGTIITVEYTAAFDSDAFVEDGNAKGNYKLINTATISHDGGFEATATTKPGENVSVYDTLAKNGEVVKTDTDKNGMVTKYVEWAIDLHMNQMYTMDELAGADTVTITDVLSDTDLLKYVDDSVAVYDLDVNGKAVSPIPADAYTVKVSGKRIVVTLQQPALHPNIRMKLRTKSNIGGEAVSNKAEVSLLGQTIRTESPEMTLDASVGGYIRSKVKFGDITVVKTDKNTGDVLPDTGFLLYKVDDKGNEALVSHIVANMGMTKGSYVYDTQEASDVWVNGEDSPLVTDENGQVVIEHLPFGFYVLREVQQVPGYMRVDADGNPIQYSFAVSNETCVYDREANTYIATFEWAVENRPAELWVHKYYEETIQGTEYVGDIAGAKLQVWPVDDLGVKTGEAPIKEAVTDANGRVMFDYLAPGTYVVSEAAAPSGFVLADDVFFVVQDDGTIDSDDLVEGVLQMQDELVIGDICINKSGDVISDLGIITKLENYLIHGFEWITGKLSDVTFNVYASEDIRIHNTVIYEKDALIATVTTGADGTAKVEGLPAGSYYAIEQRNGEADFVVTSEPIHFVLRLVYDENGQTTDMDVTQATQDVVNKRRKVSVSVLKKDSHTKEPISGATFGLYSSVTQGIYTANQMVDVAVSDANGQVTFEQILPPGQYYVKELVAPAGYLLNDVVKSVTIPNDDAFTAENQYVADFTFEIEDDARVLKLYKRDEDGNLLSGCHLKLVDSTGATVDSWVSDENPHEVRGILPGIYTLHEVAPVDGYTTAVPVTIIVDAANDVSYRGIYNGYMVNKPIDTEFLKVDGVTDDVLIGAVLELTDKDGNVVDTWTTGRVPHRIEKLPIGVYTLTEKEAPTGYLTAEPMEIVVSDTRDKQTFVMKDYQMKSGTVVLTKTDAITDKVIAGAEFALYEQLENDEESLVSFAAGTKSGTYLYQDGGTVNNLVTGMDGKISITALPFGDYVLRETKPAAGYQNPDGLSFAFSVNDETCSYDEKTGEGVGIFTFDAKNEPSALHVYKYTGDGMKVTALSGALLQVWKVDESGELAEKVSEGVTDENGNLVFTYLIPGDYKLVEAKAPDGYVIADAIPFTVDENGVCDDIQMQDKVTQVSITKSDITTGEPVIGATLVIKDLNGNVLDTWVTGEQPYVITTLPVGTYRLIETQAPDGYVKAEEVIFEVKDVATVQKVDMKDDYTKVNISKVDITTDEEIAGATLTLTDADGNVIDTWVSETEPHYLEKLPVGKYTLTEVTAPDGYTKAEAITFDVYETGEIQAVKMVDGHTHVEISKTDITGSIELSGATLEVKNADDEVVDRWVSDGTTHVITKLPAGTYTLTEISAPAGYVTAETISFTITDDLDKVVKVEMKDDVTKVEISKTDITNGEPVIGATLVIKDADGNEVATWVTDENPHYIEKLPVGSYTLTETMVPDGYVTAETVEFTVKDTGEIQKVNMTDDVTKVEISKTDIIDGKPVIGATLVIKDADGNEVATWVTDEKPHYIEKLSVGSYTLTEMMAPDGYVTAETVEFTVKDTGEIQKVNMTDDVTKVEISKTDITNGKPVIGATLVIKDADGNEVVTWVTDEKPYYVEKLPVGVYTLTEISVPDGYVTAETVEFTVKDTGEIQKVNMIDDVTKVEISKTDITNGKSVIGATLTITDKDGNEVATWVTDEKPYYIEKLPVGEYVLTEVTAPDGYVKAEAVSFMVKDMGDIQKVKMLDDYTKVHISKVDITTGKELPGAKLVVKDANGDVVEEWISEATPHVIERLKPGHYSLTEVTAPDGYEVAETIMFEVKETGEVQAVVMKDVPKPSETETESESESETETESESESETETESETERETPSYSSGGHSGNSGSGGTPVSQNGKAGSISTGDVSMTWIAVLALLAAVVLAGIWQYKKRKQKDNKES